MYPKQNRNCSSPPVLSCKMSCTCNKCWFKQRKSALTARSIENCIFCVRIGKKPQKSKRQKSLSARHSVQEIRCSSTQHHRSRRSVNPRRIHRKEPFSIVVMKSSEKSDPDLAVRKMLSRNLGSKGKYIFYINCNKSILIIQLITEWTYYYLLSRRSFWSHF